MYDIRLEQHFLFFAERYIEENYRQITGPELIKLLNFYGDKLMPTILQYKLAVRITETDLFKQCIASKQTKLEVGDVSNNVVCTAEQLIGMLRQEVTQSSLEYLCIVSSGEEFYRKLSLIPAPARTEQIMHMQTLYLINGKISLYTWLLKAADAGIEFAQTTVLEPLQKDLTGREDHQIFYENATFAVQTTTDLIKNGKLEFSKLYLSSNKQFTLDVCLAVSKDDAELTNDAKLTFNQLPDWLSTLTKTEVGLMQPKSPLHQQLILLLVKLYLSNVNPAPVDQKRSIEKLKRHLTWLNKLFNDSVFQLLIKYDPRIVDALAKYISEQPVLSANGPIINVEFKQFFAGCIEYFIAEFRKQASATKKQSIFGACPSSEKYEHPYDVIIQSLLAGQYPIDSEPADDEQMQFFEQLLAEIDKYEQYNNSLSEKT